jgi:hypothetical protein
MNAPLEPGVCRYCRCTNETPCMLSTAEPCAWLDAERTVCNAPGCVRQYHVDLGKKASTQFRTFLSNVTFGRRSRAQKPKRGRKRVA